MTTPPNDTADANTGHATIPMAHHGWRLERRAEHGRSSRPECVVVGHAWATDPAQDGWMLCLVREVVRAP